MNELGIKQVLKYLKMPIGQIEEQGDWLNLPCPFAPVFHRGKIDSNPSFGIRVDEEGESNYHCFSCKQGGPLTFLPDKIAQYVHKKIGGDLEGRLLVQELELKQAVDIEFKVKNKINQNIEKPIPQNEFIYQNFFEHAWQVSEARRYLEKRNISEATTQKLGLRFDDKHRRILFPIYGVDKNFYGYTGRTTRDDWVNQKYKDDYDGKTKTYGKVKDYFGLKKKLLMLGEHQIDKKKPTIVVEGLFAYASLHNQNVDQLANIVALLGSQMTPEKANTLIKNAGAVYLMLDNDKAGRDGIYGLGTNKGALELLLNYLPVFIPEYEGDIDNLVYKDIDEILEMTYPYSKPLNKSYKNYY